MHVADAAPATGNNTVDLILQIIQIPVFGLTFAAFIYLFGTGRVVTKREHDRVVKDRDDERLERIKSQDALISMLPTLTLAQEALKDATRAIDKLDWRDQERQRRSGRGG